MSGCKAQNNRAQDIGWHGAVRRTSGQHDIGCQGAGRRTVGPTDGSRPTDKSPTDGSPWTKMGTATSEVTTPQLTRELCDDGDGNVEL
jgi:hypothetical protein